MPAIRLFAGMARSYKMSHPMGGPKLAPGLLVAKLLVALLANGVGD